jgi:hypothetical protein
VAVMVFGVGTGAVAVIGNTPASDLGTTPGHGYRLGHYALYVKAFNATLMT